MCWRYSSSVVAPIARQLAACQHRLEHVAGVHRALGRPRPDDRVQLVDEGDDLAAAVGDLLEDGLQTLLELTAVLGAGDHRAEIERDQPLVLQRLRHVTGHDPLRETFHDRGLAHARLTDQHRVVLRAAREHLDRASDLLVSADHRVELAQPRLLGEVAPVLLERLEGVLGALARDPPVPAHLREGGEDPAAREPGVGEQSGRGRAGGLDQREEQVLRRDVLVGQRLGLARRGLEHPARRRRDPDLITVRIDLGHAIQRVRDARAQLARVRARRVEHRQDDPLGVGQEAEQHVLGLDRLVVARGGLLLRLLQRRLRSDRQLVDVHVDLTSSKSVCVMPYIL